MQRQRKIYETETRRRQMEQTADILSVCRKKLQRADQEEWQSKQVCDGHRVGIFFIDMDHKMYGRCLILLFMANANSFHIHMH